MATHQLPRLARVSLIAYCAGLVLLGIVHITAYSITTGGRLISGSAAGVAMFAGMALMGPSGSRLQKVGYRGIRVFAALTAGLAIWLLIAAG